MLGLVFMALAALVCIVTLWRWRDTWLITRVALALWCAALVAALVGWLPRADVTWVAGCTGVLIALNVIVALGGPPDPGKHETKPS